MENAKKTFLLPFSMGACEALGGNVVTDAFGVVAMVTMAPLIITIQILGLIMIQEQMKEKQATKDYTSIKVFRKSRQSKIIEL